MIPTIRYLTFVPKSCLTNLHKKAKYKTAKWKQKDKSRKNKMSSKKKIKS